jgi:hypothetical protein
MESISKSNERNLRLPGTRTSTTSESMSIQQRDQLETQQGMRFGVREFAGLVVESNCPAFCAEPSKAVPLPHIRR